MLRHHLERMPFPSDSTLLHLRLSTAQLSDDYSEGRIFSSFMHAWVWLGHFPLAREPAVLQYVLSLHIIAVWPAQPALHAGSDLSQRLMEHGCRLPPLRCCYLGPHDFYRRVYFGTGTAVSLRTVAGGPLEHTRAYLARPSPLTMNGVAGELLGLVPALRAAHSDLRIWLARDHPSHLRVMPDILRTEWEGTRDIRAFADYLQRELGVSIG